MLITKKTIEVKITNKFPDMPWEIIWENISAKFVSSQARSVLFEVFNDVYPNRIKMFNHNFANVSNCLCEICDKHDSNIHRIKECKNSKIVYDWVSDIIKTKFKIRMKSAEEIIYKSINVKDSKARSALWLVSEMIMYNMKYHKNSCLYSFKKLIRDARWNNKKLFDKQFGKFLNFC